MFSQSVLEEVFSLGLATPGSSRSVRRSEQSIDDPHRVKDYFLVRGLYPSFSAKSRLWRRNKIKSLLNKLDGIRPMPVIVLVGGSNEHRANVARSLCRAHRWYRLCRTDSASHAGTSQLNPP